MLVSVKYFKNDLKFSLSRHLLLHPQIYVIPVVQEACLTLNS